MPTTKIVKHVAEILLLMLAAKVILKGAAEFDLHKIIVDIVLFLQYFLS